MVIKRENHNKENIIVVKKSTNLANDMDQIACQIEEFRKAKGYIL